MEIAIWAIVIAFFGLVCFGWFMFCKNHPVLGMLLALLTLSGD